MSTASSNDSIREAGLWREALVRTLGLSVLFVVVYGLTSWITSLRSDVGTWYYAWERLIPFVPLMIIPYMSIDLFFVAGPFLCRDRRELRLLSRRIVLAILVAGVCFLVYPLQLAVERPTASGWIGVIWNWFKGLDRPYNLLPSLHITLRTILADLYVRHTRGVTRLATHVWFSLIGFSTLLTYQHHTVDVIGGFILATFCFYLVGEVPLRLPVVPNMRVGGRYVVLGGGAGGAVCRHVARWRDSALADYFRGAIDRRLLRARTEHLSQADRTVAAELADHHGPGDHWPISVARVLHTAMPRMGRRRAGRVDRPAIERRRGGGRRAGRRYGGGRSYGRILGSPAVLASRLPPSSGAWI